MIEEGDLMPFKNFVKFTAGKCKLQETLVLYLCISLLVLNKYLLLTVNRSIESIRHYFHFCKDFPTRISWSGVEE
jgi:hypothetical protein